MGWMTRCHLPHSTIEWRVVEMKFYMEGFSANEVFFFFFYPFNMFKLITLISSGSCKMATNFYKYLIICLLSKTNQKLLGKISLNSWIPLANCLRSWKQNKWKWTAATVALFWCLSFQNDFYNANVTTLEGWLWALHPLMPTLAIFEGWDSQCQFRFILAGEYMVLFLEFWDL